MKFHELPHRLRIYIIAHVFAVLPLLWLLAQQDPPKSWSAVGALLVATVIFSTWRVELTVFQGRMTLTNAGVCLALLLQGVQAAVLCATVGGIVSTIARPGDGPLKLKLVKPELYRAFFNVANCGISCAIAALFYREVAPFAPNEALKVLLGLTTFTGFYFMFNTLGVAGACALQQNLRWIAVWQQNFLWTAPGFFASASVAVAIQQMGQHKLS
ncbi:MAG TPA: hypothetical protein VK689_04830, partial [Armatimonadota bacterium]|nr:hypothetical protein [Armatimonadota bacterium]